MSAETTRFPLNESASALPAGTRLGEFEITGLLGIGGFGIVYLAFDHALEREVAIKEYMPAMMAGRTETMHVSLRSQSDAETFALGLRSFVNEAKLLARFDHPALLKVFRFWEGNGTAYMAMPVLRGRTLKQIRATLDEPPDESWLRSVLEPLLGAIEHLHNAGVYHRDIAPDNIQVEPDGHPVLVDFGAARRVITDKTQTLTAILKPAYAPIEQYAEVASVKQGPWTDLYALGATLHFMLLGRPPSPATTRAVHDDVQPLAQQALPGCRPEFLAAIDWMLNPRPVDRPQSVAALREVLDGMAALPPAALQAASVAQAAAQAAPRAWDRTLVAGRSAPAAGDGVGRTDIDLPLAAAAVSADSVDLALDSTPAAPLAEPAGAEPDPEATRVVPRSVAAAPAPALAAASAPAPATAAAPTAAPAAPTPAPAAPLPAPVPAEARRPPWLWVAVGGGVLAVAAAVFGLRGGSGSAEGPAPAASVAAGAPAEAPASAASAVGAATAVLPGAPVAASKPAASASAPGRSPAATPPAPAAVAIRPATSPAPEPARPAATPAAQVPVPTPAAAAPAAPLPAAAATPTAGAAVPAAAAPRPVAAPPATAAGATPAPGSAGGSVVEPARPAPTAEAPKPAGPSAAAPAAPAAGPAAIGPEAKCDGRNPVMYFLCMERECLRGANQNHPDCVKWRQSKPPEQR